MVIGGYLAGFAGDSAPRAVFPSAVDRAMVRTASNCAEEWTFTHSLRLQNNNNNTIWRGSVLTGEELPRHSGELNHALSQEGGPT